MAYIIVQLFPRLCIYPPGRKSEGRRKNISKFVDCVFSNRTLARCELEFCGLGAVVRYVFDFREDCTAKIFRADSKDSTVDVLYGYCFDWLGVFPGRHSASGGCLYQEHVFARMELESFGNHADNDEGKFLLVHLFFIYLCSQSKIMEKN